MSIPYKFQIPTSASAFLAWLLTFLCVEYKSDLQVGDKGISDGRVEVNFPNREEFWRFWHAYCKPLIIEPYLEEVDLQTKTRVAIGFIDRVQKVSHGREKQVQVEKVRAALRCVNTNIALDTGQQPLHKLG